MAMLCAGMLSMPSLTSAAPVGEAGGFCGACIAPGNTCLVDFVCIRNRCRPGDNEPCDDAAGNNGGNNGGNANNPLLRPPTPIRLYAPANDVFDQTGSTVLPYQSLPTNLWGLGPLFYYFNLTFPWLLGIAAGISILQAIAGGIQIMMSGGSEQRSAGESRLTWALVGLVLVGLAGFILRVLNPIFYR